MKPIIYSQPYIKDKEKLKDNKKNYDCEKDFFLMFFKKGWDSF